MYEYRAIVTGVYDGDTIKVDIDQGFHDWKHEQKLRLYGVQTPEVKGEDKELGIAVRDEVRGLLRIEPGGRWGRGPGFEITLKTHKDRSGKFGRWLATVTVGELNLNEFLIEQGYPCPPEWL